MKPLSLQPTNGLSVTAMLFLVLFLASPICQLFGQQTIPADIFNGPDSTTLEIHVGDANHIAKDVIGVQLVFHGDFSEVLPTEYAVDLDVGWFCNGNSGSGHSWELNSDSTAATLTVWDLDSALCTGYGMFLELYRALGSGHYELDDIMKTGPPLEATLLTRTTVFPNPANSSDVIKVVGVGAGQVAEVMDQMGNVVIQLEGRDGALVLPNLPAGLYVLKVRSSQTGAVASWKKFVVN